MMKGSIQVVALQDLYNTALIRIGQQLVNNEVSLELPYASFQKLVQFQVFPLYSKYIYKSEYLTLFLQYAQPYTFPEPSPDIVSTIIPVSIYGLYMGEMLRFRFTDNQSFLSTRPLSRFAMSWDYRKPVLYVGYQGEVEVRCHWRVKYDTVADTVEVDPDTQDILVDLLAGYSMIALGRSRRMVKIGDSNMEFDASDMVNEGEALVKEARDRLIALADLTAVNF